MKNSLDLINKIIEKVNIRILLVFVFIVQLILSLQGFDVCDEGWYLSFYQQIFQNPETVEYNFLFWLTGIVGGVWYSLFPNGGILSFRILTSICYVISAYFVFNILKPYVKKKLLVIGVLMCVFISDFGLISFYYNHMSSLLFIISVFYLLKGIKSNNRNFYVFLAGLITGLNIFSRLPNVVLLIIVLLIPLQLFWNKNIGWLRKVFVFLVGVFSSFLLVFLVMKYLGHLDVAKQAFFGLIGKGGNADSNHNILKLLENYFFNYKIIIKKMIIISFVTTLSVLIMSLNNKKIIRYLAAFCSFLFFWEIFENNNIHTLYSIGFLGSILTFFNNKKEKNIALIAVLMMVAIPLGSDGGIRNVGYVCLWFSIPLFLNSFFNLNVKNIFLLRKMGEDKLNKINIDFKIILALFVLTYFSSKIYTISNQAYFDNGSRFKKTVKVQNRLANVYTTNRRAKIINDLLTELKKHVKKGEYLLAYDNLPMLNYLTNTKPYMYISWVWVYDSVTFEKKIKQAQKENDELPVVVLQKFRTIGHFSEPVKNYMDENKIEGYIYKRGRTKSMNRFLKGNNYKVMWSNDYFEILKSL